jgi:hypothetical protein
MGQHTDWFIATEGEAEALGTAEDPFHGRWPHLQIKGVLLMELSLLYGMLTGHEEEEEGGHLSTELYMSPQLKQQQEALQGLGTEEAAERASEMTWEGVVVCQVSPEFVEALAALTPQEQEEVAAEWQALEELQHLEPEYVVEVLGELVGFAQKAMALKRPILELQVM